jgi:rod shape determining protein RodA
VATRVGGLGQAIARARFPALDWPLAWAALGLVVIGLATVYSATSVPGAHHGLWLKQLLWALGAFLAAWMAASVPYRVYDSLAYPVYAISLVLLALVLVAGTSAYGARRWLDLGFFNIQPSELAKIATVLVLARRMDDPKLDLSRIRDWVPPLVLTLVPFALIVREPDLGTSLVFPIILVAMYFWAGMPVPQLLLGLSPMLNVLLFVVTGTIAWFGGLLAGMLLLFRPRLPALIAVLLINVGVAVGMPHLWSSLHDYQKRRIETFLNPGQDPHGSGYQIIQSRIAIGSGGVTGKGYLRGTQKALAFLPMRHTDFVYSVVGEELGLLGALFVMLLYSVLILRGYRVALQARNGFASLMVVGLVTALFYHIMVNVLMTIGWAPVTGLPLPLLSYGGTALVVNAVQIGLVLNVAMRRQEF